MLGINEEILRASVAYYSQEETHAKDIQDAQKQTQRSMKECKKKHLGQEVIDSVTMSEEEALRVLAIKLQISINLIKEFKGLEEEMKDTPEKLAEAQKYLPNMVHDHLYFATGLEIDDFEEVVDTLGLKYQGKLENGTQITVTPG